MRQGWLIWVIAWACGSKPEEAPPPSTKDLAPRWQQQRARLAYAHRHASTELAKPTARRASCPAPMSS